jgi:hypothetical protein
MINSQPTKKPKLEVKQEDFLVMVQPSSEEMLGRIVKHFSSDNKLLKSL